MMPLLTTQKDEPMDTTSTPNPSTDRVSDLVQKLVAAAATEAESAAERARTDAERRLQVEIDRLQGELRDEREQLMATREDLDVVRMNLALVQRELEEEQAEKAMLLSALQNVRRAVSFDGGGARPDPPGPPTPDNRPADDDRTDDKPATAPELAGLLELDAVMTPGPEGLDRPAQAHRPLKLVNKTLVATAESHLALGPADHVAQLLAQIEDVYRSDLKSSFATSDLIARVEANLNYAREVFARRLDPAQSLDTTLFDRQLAVFLAARADSLFGRHLAIASKPQAASATAHPAPEDSRAADADYRTLRGISNVS